MATQTRETGPPGTRDGNRDGDGSPTTVSLDGGRRLAYAEHGAPEGTPVVFLHGTPGSRRLGELFDTAARARGIRILAPDRPGFGTSSPWPARSISDTARVVTAVLEDVGVERAGVVAFSGGCPYALATAATSPERVDRVDVISGATPPDAGDDPAIQRVLGGLATRTPTVLGGLFRGQAWLARRLDPSVVVSQYTDAAEAIPAETAELVRADFVEAFATHRSGAVTEFRHAASAWDIEFDAVDVPVRFWHGDADANVPIAGVYRLAEWLPDARLEPIADADHLRTLLRCRADVLDRHCGGTAPGP
ncbi:Pimeloyl-ACP methyl ester carboxylesterase [Halorientalis persicus]|jgi:pimeloyl-ACP methyl ester carboxylesterase|uniref:Pimeloyl-ACP methyl ester carboxylesterase n=1 Tax=Halorientalis persicus TaxID=1367881 RepID=A0A1H8TDU0_9EURY|nr:alpha/beta hydrolase [Halorientalis persicus]SEO88916.1 Pimeloyl-ACP methyl ester carboxylesterase [Halorientalis persicus]